MKNDVQRVSTIISKGLTFGYIRSRCRSSSDILSWSLEEKVWFLPIQRFLETRLRSDEACIVGTRSVRVVLIVFKSRSVTLTWFASNNHNIHHLRGTNQISLTYWDSYSKHLSWQMYSWNYLRIHLQMTCTRKRNGCVFEVQSYVTDQLENHKFARRTCTAELQGRHTSSLAYHHV